MNFLVKPLDNIKVRQAFALAVDRDVLNQAAWHGAYIPSCHIIPQGMPGYNPNLTCPAGSTTKGDAAKAKQLFTQGLQEEGMTPATFPNITYTYPTQSPEAAARMTDPNARLQAYNRLEQELVNDVTWLSIYQRPEIHVLKTYVIGLKENAQALFRADGWANVYIAQH